MSFQTPEIAREIVRAQITPSTCSASPDVLSSDLTPSLRILPNTHLPALDAVRGLAILMVLGFHFTMMTANDNWLSMKLCKAIVLGRCGVDLFFVLSGFLITGLLYDAKESPGFFRTFYARRVLRIFPLYYVTLAILLWVLPAFGKHVVGDEVAQRQGWLWLHSTNLGLMYAEKYLGISGYLGAFGHLWSLAVEEHFYLVWPMVVFFFDRRSLVKICGAVAIGGLAFRVWLMSRGDNEMAAYLLTPGRIDQLALGGMAALIARSPAGLRPMIRPAKWLAVASFALLFVILAVRDRFRVGDHDDKLMPTIGYSVLGVGFAACIILAVAVQKGTRLWPVVTAKPLRMFGKYSYALYIWHLFIFDWILERWPIPKQTSIAGFGVLYATLLTACMAAALATAWLSWHLLEKRFLSLKRYFVYDSPGSGSNGDRQPKGPPPRNAQRRIVVRPYWKPIAGIVATACAMACFIAATAVVWKDPSVVTVPACSFWLGVGVMCVLLAREFFGSYPLESPGTVRTLMPVNAPASPPKRRREAAAEVCDDEGELLTI